MYKCEVCSKEFSTERSLIGHKSVHRIGGRYSVSRKKKYVDFECQNCGKMFGRKSNSLNKFCSTFCFGEKTRKETKFRIESNEQVSSGSLRKYLLDSAPWCSECQQGLIWNKKPLSLQHDHIDGNSDNNCLKNSRLLCPNCHTQTETFGVKGLGVGQRGKDTKRNKYLREYKAGLV